MLQKLCFPIMTTAHKQDVTLKALGKRAVTYYAMVGTQLQLVPVPSKP